MPSAKFNVSFDENAGKTADDVTSNGFDQGGIFNFRKQGRALETFAKNHIGRRDVPFYACS